jgi:hypothetical protein
VPLKRVFGGVYRPLPNPARAGQLHGETASGHANRPGEQRREETQPSCSAAQRIRSSAASCGASARRTKSAIVLTMRSVGSRCTAARHDVASGRDGPLRSLRGPAADPRRGDRTPWVRRLLAALGLAPEPSPGGPPPPPDPARSRPPPAPPSPYVRGLGGTGSGFHLTDLPLPCRPLRRALHSAHRTDVTPHRDDATPGRTPGHVAGARKAVVTAEVLGLTSTVCPGWTKSSPPARRTAARAAAVMVPAWAMPTTVPAASRGRAAATPRFAAAPLARSFRARRRLSSFEA